MTEYVQRRVDERFIAKRAFEMLVAVLILTDVDMMT